MTMRTPFRGALTALSTLILAGTTTFAAAQDIRPPAQPTQPAGATPDADRAPMAPAGVERDGGGVIAGAGGATPIMTGFTYQGRLVQGGTPYNGNADFQFTLFDAASGGTNLGSVNLTGVPVNNGVFTVQLDFGQAVFSADRWLRIVVNGNALSPRQKITPTPFALQTRGIYVDGSDHVAIGTNVPGTAALRLNDPAGSFGVGAMLAFQDQDYASIKNSADGQLEFHTGISEQDIIFTGDPSTAVGINVTDPLAALHVVGNARVDSASGGYELVHSVTGDGWRFATSNGGQYLELQDLPSQASPFVFTDVGLGLGVVPSFPLDITTAGGTSINVDNPGGVGFGDGVTSTVRESGAYAIYGIALDDATRAGTFLGDVSVSGNLTKGSGSFKIDHPLDPENKYLAHSFVESPDMMNVYNGNVVLDERGEAWVEMPDYFEALNTDFRYQLTAIGAPGPNLYVATEIDGNRFRIAGGQPGSKVSWQVTGVRNDAFARHHRIEVEPLKPEEERGLYLHPEAFGLGDELHIRHAHDGRAERRMAEAGDVDHE